MLKFDPPEKLEYAKLQEWPDWKQCFERFRCAMKLNKEDEVLQINALIGIRDKSLSQKLQMRTDLNLDRDSNGTPVRVR